MINYLNKTERFRNLGEKIAVWARLLPNSCTMAWKTVGKHLILIKSDWGVLVLPTGIKNSHVLPGEREMENRQGRKSQTLSNSRRKVKIQINGFVVDNYQPNYIQSR